MAHFVHNNQQHNLYRAGNGETSAMFWGIFGSLSATFSPLLFWARNNEMTVSAGKLSLATNFILISAASTYIAVYFLLRKHPAMRVRRGWVGAASLNFVASIIVTVVTVKHEPKVENVYGLMLVAVAVLALGEVAKPVFDFGLVQAFLRMPLQTALVCRFALHNGEVGPVTIIIAAILLFVGTLWQAYFAIGEIWPAGADEDEDE